MWCMLSLRGSLLWLHSEDTAANEESSEPFTQDNDDGIPAQADIIIHKYMQRYHQRLGEGKQAFRSNSVLK